MNIEQAIAELLYRHQCVIVPNFGAFLTETKTAFLDQNSNTFFPPRKLVSFNPHLKNNDGLLANHIALAEQISYNSAVSTIENEVVNWNNSLKNNASISLKNIGELVQNGENNLVFTPKNSTNYLMASFGLTEFVSPSIKREVAKQLETVVAEEKPLIEEPKVVVLEKSTSKFNYLKYAAVFVVGLGILGTIGYNYNQKSVANQTIVVEAAAQKQVQNKIQEATFTIQNPLPAVTLNVKEEKLLFHIVAGAFRSEENAQNEYQNLVSKGYDAKIIEANKYGLHPVLFGSFATVEEANEFKAKVQQNGSPDAWLLIQQL